MNDDSFAKSLKFVLEHETVFKPKHYGDYDYAITEFNPKDPGGKTRFGIDQRSHPNVSIDDLTVDEASEIYYKEYWLAGKANQLPFPLSLVHFDGCVNTGIGQATKFLQRAVGAHDDGAFGPATKKAALEACEREGAVTIAKKICKMKREFYKYLVTKNSDNEEFIDGWLNRVADVEKEVQNGVA